MGNISRVKAKINPMKINSLNLNNLKNKPQNKLFSNKSNIVETVIDEVGEEIQKDVEIIKSKALTIGTIQDDFNSEIDLEPYKERMQEIIDFSKNKRETVTNLAIFLSSEFPKLPYLLDYSSGHDGTSLLGLDWTKEIVQREDGTYGERTLDCSGLVSWCFANAGIDVPGYGNTKNYHDYVGDGNALALVGNSLENIEPGDLAFTPNGGGHIGIIVDVDKENKEITIVHTSGSGSGVNITKISTETGLITSDDTGSAGVDRTGQSNYFTEILHVPYEE